MRVVFASLSVFVLALACGCSGTSPGGDGGAKKGGSVSAVFSVDAGADGSDGSVGTRADELAPSLDPSDDTTEALEEPAR